MKKPVRVIVCGGMAVAAAAAAGPAKPDGNPSLLTELGVAPAEWFAPWLARVLEARPAWLAAAERATPPLRRATIRPRRLVRPERSPEAFQGWTVADEGPPDALAARPQKPGDSFTLDFGEHRVGRLSFDVAPAAHPIDAPLRLRLVFAETPAELGEPFDPYGGTLSRSWLQDEVVNIDDTPATVALPRRYAFRYVRFEVVAGSPHARAIISNVRLAAETSADESRWTPPAGATERQARIDEVAARTLRDCMQTVFEDGPKRDRRLWLGDLRLQALANYATFRNFDLVRRCLYLLAGTATDRGLVATCVFERPAPTRGRNHILDYTALFAPTVLEFLDASGDRATAESLWPVAVRLLEFTLEPVGPDGLFRDPKNWWLFVDWDRELDRQAPEQAVILFGLRATAELGRRLGREADLPWAAAAIAQMESAARRDLWDPAAGMFVSGEGRQVSWASQAWMILAGVTTPDEARAVLQRVAGIADARRPVTPYLHHFIVEAYQRAGMDDRAMAHLEAYWGGMVDRGADTFWEVWAPENELESPYRSHLMNSYCHAWSCTPSWFLRRRRAAGP